MNICFFGSYTRDYPRNKILIDGLEKNGANVIHCQSSAGSIFRRYPELVVKFWKIKDHLDIIYVAFFGHLDMPLAWVLAKLTGKKVIFDMFYSMYDTYVFDRQSVKQKSIKSLSYWCFDKLSATCADVIVTDTRSHARYFQELLYIAPSKFHRIYVGGDETIFKPIKAQKKRKKILVEFHGMFTRLHGAEYFVEAAKLLEHYDEIEFLLIGSTANYPLPVELFEKLRPINMKYFPKMEVTKLAQLVAGSDICIGHVGATKKAKCVITNKMFHGLATKVAVIAGDCPASRELLQDKKNALFVTMNNSQELAKKILILVKNSRLRVKIAENGYALSQQKLTNKHLGRELLTVAEALLSKTVSKSP